MNPAPAPRAALLRLLAAGLPPPGEFPLKSLAPEEGIFGPGSATWQVMREPLLILGAARALLMQAAHPLIAQGALDHSDFATDPIGRFQRTAAWVTTVVFGTSEEARTAIREVNRVHRRVRGSLPTNHATSAWASGTAYGALERPLLLWVHGSLIDAMLTTHRAVVGPLRPAPADRFVREWDAVANLMGLPAGSTWESEAQMRAWIAGQLRAGVALPGPGSRQVASVILAPGVTGPALAKITGLITSGMLPGSVRDQFGIRWTPAHEVAYQALTLGLRRARPTLPRALRISPAYEFALARVSGELQRGSVRVERLLTRLRLA